MFAIQKTNIFFGSTINTEINFYLINSCGCVVVIFCFRLSGGRVRLVKTRSRLPIGRIRTLVESQREASVDTNLLLSLLSNDVQSFFSVCFPPLVSEMVCMNLPDVSELYL